MRNGKIEKRHGIYAAYTTKLRNNSVKFNPYEGYKVYTYQVEATTAFWQESASNDLHAVLQALSSNLCTRQHRKKTNLKQKTEIKNPTGLDGALQNEIHVRKWNFDGIGSWTVPRATTLIRRRIFIAAIWQREPPAIQAAKTTGISELYEDWALFLSFFFAKSQISTNR